MRHPETVSEWRAYWQLPFVALLGMGGSGMMVYSTGVFMGELMPAFGWTRTQYMSSMTVQLVLTLFLIPLVGRAVDRYGPRRVALTGIVPAIVGTAMLGLANGEIWQWWLLTGIQTCGAVILIPPVWITAVVGRFHSSRGMALAVALAGIGLGTAVWPMLAAFYIEQIGWRLAYGAVALSWGALIVPLTLFFFYGPHDRIARRDRAAHVAVPYSHHLRSRVFVCLAAAGGLFVLTSQAITLHLVPIVRESGLSLAAAASLAGVAGIGSIAGRLGMGFLLDRWSARKLGVAVFLLPLASAMLFGYADSYPAMVFAAAVLGLSMGAEGDVLNYIASRRFDHAIFGSISSILQTVTAITSVGGVMVAGMLADYWGSYQLFLLLCVPITVIGAITLAMVPDAPEAEAPDTPEAAAPGTGAPETGTEERDEAPGRKPGGDAVHPAPAAPAVI